MDTKMTAINFQDKALVRFKNYSQLVMLKNYVQNDLGGNFAKANLNLIIKKTQQMEFYTVLAT